MSKRSSSRRDLRKASRPPSLNTVWEWQGETVEAVPATTEALLMDGGEPMSLDEPMNGPLELRSSAGLRWLSRRTWNARYGVLQPATSSMPTPRLLMFDSGERGHLHEEILLVAPLQLVALPCPQHAPPDGGSGLMRFTLSSGDASPLELAAHSDEQRQLWIFALGESMHSSSPVPRSPTSVLPKLSGKVRLKQCKLSDNYQMGKILSKGEVRSHRPSTLRLRSGCACPSMHPRAVPAPAAFSRALRAGWSLTRVCSAAARDSLVTGLPHRRGCPSTLEAKPHPQAAPQAIASHASLSGRLALTSKTRGEG